MTYAGQLDRKVTFRQPAVDPTTQENAGYADAFTRRARVQPLKGGEGVQASRMAGNQPVILFLRRDNWTDQVTNAWQAYDARAATDSPPVAIKWDVTSVIHSEDRKWVEVQAIQRLGGDV